MSQSTFQSTVTKFTLMAVFLAAASVMAPAHAGQVVIPPPATLDALWDDPADPGDDANAFVISPSGRFQFDLFTFSAVPPGEPTPGPEDIFLSLTETADTISLLFQIVQGNIIQGPDMWDLQVGFRATVLDPILELTGQTLTVNATTFGDGYLVLNEKIRDENIQDVATLTAYENLPVHGSRSSDHADFVPRETEVYVDKDLIVSGGTIDAGGLVVVSHFQQTFHFEPIPEPSGMALLILGCVGLGTIGWFSRRKMC